MSEKRSVREMFGEGLRRGAIFAAVIGVLAVVGRGERRLGAVGIVLPIAVGMYVGGRVIERRGG